MKVICVKDLFDNCILTGEQANKIPTKNKIYNVINDYEYNNSKYYILKEFGQDEAWDARAFESLDDYLNQFDESLKQELSNINELVNN